MIDDLDAQTERRPGAVPEYSLDSAKASADLASGVEAKREQRLRSVVSEQYLRGIERLLESLETVFEGACGVPQ